jgi:XTP/dITP diphosphohydrolase
VNPQSASSARAGGHRKITGRLVIATHNPGKLREMRDLLLPHGIDVVSAGELGLAEPEETGTSFRDNARIKAVAAATATGLPAFADDSGLAVDALGGEPGIHSARWAGPSKDFDRAMQTIEDKLRERGEPETRQAHFVSALCVAWPDGHLEEFEATVDGALVWPPRGDQGFGYDPMFQPTGHARTFGEMSGDEKHGLPPRGAGLSHRARAFLKLAQACLADTLPSRSA